MKLEQQVVSLELAKKLKELGVKQKSIWSWWVTTDRDDTPALNRSSRKDCPTCGHPHAPYFEEISAFTVAELGKILPANVEKDEKLWWNIQERRFLHNQEHTPTYHIRYEWNQRTLANFTEANEADARAKMLIYLIEEGLLEAVSLTP